MTPIDTHDVLKQKNYLPYIGEVEQIEPDELETIDKIIALMTKEEAITREKYGRSVRTSHGKSYALLKGELRVLASLSPELRQGLFTEAKTYPVVARLAQIPGEVLDDRKVSTPRGMSIKVVGVDGPMIDAHQDEVTQDFVLDTGKIFTVPGAKAFLAAFTPNAKVATRLSDSVKGAVSTASRATNSALHAIGLNSANLDFYGHPYLHPLGEEYYSQSAFRYGDYVAKFRVKPDVSVLKSVIGAKIDPPDENGLRTIVTEFFRSRPAEYELAVQLCTDLDKMPVEDASKEWPEEESPFVIVAHLLFPVQDAYSEARKTYVEGDVSFSPSHSLAAHRPLGSLNRARMQTYRALGTKRREINKRPVKEPRHIDEVPD